MAGKTKLIASQERREIWSRLIYFLEKVVHFSTEIWCTFHLLFTYTLYQGKKRKTWVFNMRLSYSRLDYYEIVYDQRVETFIQCHICK